MARPKCFDEDTALDAAAELFWSHGYDGTSMAQLEEGMAMGRQSIYNAFGDKHALFVKALERYIGRNRAQVEHVLLAPDAGLDAIRRFFDDLVDFATPPGPRRGCLVANSILEVGPEDEAVAHRCDANQEHVLRGLEHALANAVDRGEVAAELDVGSTARMLLAQSYGLSVLSKAGATRRELQDGVRALLTRLA